MDQEMVAKDHRLGSNIAKSDTKLWDFVFFYSLHLNDFESVKRNQRIGQHSTNVNFKFF